MSEHPGFEFNEITGRSVVRLRVLPRGANAASEALELPQQALRWTFGEPAAYWLGPDQWLLISDSQAPQDIINHIDSTLSGQLYAATDMSSSNVCFSLSGPAARTVLAMGCGIDMHMDAFKTGHCVHTLFANVLLFIVAVEDNGFELYVDRSHSRYLSNWIIDSGQDPITRDAKYYQVAAR
jgi:sarcosine oxidase subunit gamma